MESININNLRYLLSLVNPVFVGFQKNAHSFQDWKSIAKLIVSDYPCKVDTSFSRDIDFMNHIVDSNLAVFPFVLYLPVVSWDTRTSNNKVGGAEERFLSLK